MIKAQTVILEDEEDLLLIDESLRGLFDDNGGFSDFGAWLPSSPIPAEEVEEAGVGKTVIALWLSDEEFAARYGALDIYERAMQDGDWELFIEQVCDKQYRQNRDENLNMAHFGAYGALDSLWVVVIDE